MIPISVIVAGTATGAGAGLLVLELLPGPPRLDAALARLQVTAPARRTAPGAGIRNRLGRYLLDHHEQIPGASVPSADLALIGKTPEHYLFDKIAISVATALVMPYLWFMGLVVSIDIPWPFVLTGSLLIALVFYVAAEVDVKAKASHYRTEADVALTAYLDLVALRRAGEAGISESLETAATMAEGWLFTRLSEAIQRARDERQAPWEGLRALGTELDLPALRDIAGIIATAGNDGAGIYNALRAKCAAMRTALGNAESEAAATSTVKLTMIGGLLALVLIVLIGFPAVYRIMGT